jgi:hypothetical protein
MKEKSKAAATVPANSIFPGHAKGNLDFALTFGLTSRAG